MKVKFQTVLTYGYQALKQWPSEVFKKGAKNPEKGLKGLEE